MTSSGDDFPGSSGSSPGGSRSRLHQATPVAASESRLCTICLGTVHNAAYVAYCMHRFCFACIRQWSATRAECPLCRSPFTSILHTVRADNDYEEHIVRRSDSSSSNSHQGQRLGPRARRQSSSSSSDSSDSSDSSHTGSPEGARSPSPRHHRDGHRHHQRRAGGHHSTRRSRRRRSRRSRSRGRSRYRSRRSGHSMGQRSRHRSRRRSRSRSRRRGW